MPGVAGDDLPQVQCQLDDPEWVPNETVVVIGAGDAAVENVLALANHNRVVLINRNDEFARCKERNLSLVLAAIEDERFECRYGTRIQSIEAVVAATSSPPSRVTAQTPQGSEAIVCHRVIARLGATPPRKLVRASASFSKAPIPRPCLNCQPPMNPTCLACTSSAPSMQRSL